MSIKSIFAEKRGANQAATNSQAASIETSQAFKAREILMRQNEINRRGKV
jgi:hypothetical protein